MAMQHTRILSKVFRHRLPSQLVHISQRFAGHGYETEGDTNGAPYRPWPLDKFTWATTGDYWSKEYPQQSETGDQYASEEVYLDEIEDRMRKYDKKYSQSDKIKNLYNEFGWENQDDRAFTTYGGSLSQGDALQYGRGKKIDPSQYINAEFNWTARKPIAPVEYLTAEQVRRSRGSLANYREMPPEQPSIWKYWNAYTTGAAFFLVLVSKEIFILGGHDMWDAILYWTMFGLIGSGLGDLMAHGHAMASQEQYDREYFMLNDKVQKLNKQIEALASKPNERRILLNLIAYRDELAEKVLQKTLSNRVSRLVESCNRKLSDKLTEEASIKRDAESNWSKEALNKTLNYFEDGKVRTNFMNDALSQFCAPNVASLKTKSAASMPTDIFTKKYEESYNATKSAFLQEQQKAGTLSWVFVDAKERAKKQLSKSAKESEFSKRVKAWEATHNPVNAAAPAFA